MPKQQNPFSDFFSPKFTQGFSGNDFTKLFENYQSVPFDLQAFMETQRKNIQAITEAQQAAFEGVQALAHRQAEIISQMVEDNSTLAKGALSEGTPEEKMAQNADIFKAAYERSIENMNELSELINKSNQNATKIINKRVSASVNELKAAIKTTDKKAA